MLRLTLWQISRILEKSGLANSGFLFDLEHASLMQKCILQYFLFFKTLIFDGYRSGYISQVYSGMMDFMKYHLLNCMLPYLSESIIVEKNKNSVALLEMVPNSFNPKMLREFLVLSSPVLPFTTEEVFFHNFKKSMYTETTYNLMNDKDLRNHSEGKAAIEKEQLRLYRFLYDVKAKVDEQLNVLFRHAKKKDRKRYTLHVYYEFDSLNEKKNLGNCVISRKVQERTGLLLRGLGGDHWYDGTEAKG